MEDLAAVLIALIGVGGTLVASLIGVWSEPWRKKKEREVKKKSLREGLYKEAARVLATMYTFAVELDENQRFLNPQSEEEHAKKMLEIFEIFNPVVENLKSGIYSLAKKDPELAVLFYELSESATLDSIYSIVHVIPELTRLDVKLRWSSIRSQVTGIHYRLVTAIKKGLLDRDLLIASCSVPAEAEFLEDFLNMPLSSVLQEDSEVYKKMRELKKRFKASQ